MKFLSRPLTFGCLFLVCLGGLAGCESGKKRDATVQGTVTLDGELTKSGTVVFHPSDSVPVAYGTVRRDGTFALRIGQGNQRDLDHSEIYPGSYVATVTIRGSSTPDVESGEGAPPKPGARLSATKYSNKETSGLAYTIKPGMNVINIEVEAATEEEVSEEENHEDGTDTAETGEQSAGEEESATEVDDSEEGSPPREVVESSSEESSP